MHVEHSPVELHLAQLLGQLMQPIEPLTGARVAPTSHWVQVGSYFTFLAVSSLEPSLEEDAELEDSELEDSELEGSELEDSEIELELLSSTSTVLNLQAVHEEGQDLQTFLLSSSP